MPIRLKARLAPLLLGLAGLAPAAVDIVAALGAEPELNGGGAEPRDP